MILKCTCKHAYQDSVYGDNMRVHNPCNKGNRCTVCGNVSEKKDSAEDKKDSKNKWGFFMAALNKKIKVTPFKQLIELNE